MVCIKSSEAPTASDTEWCSSVRSEMGFWTSISGTAMTVEVVKGLKGGDKAARPGDSREVDL